MRKTATIATVAVVVLAAAGSAVYVLARLGAGDELDTAVANFRAALPPGSSFTYATASPRLLTRSGHFTDAVLTTNGTTLAAATLDLTPGPGRTLRHLAATNVTVGAAATKAGDAKAGDAKAGDGQVSMDRFDVDALTVPPPGPAGTVDPAAVTFDHAAAHAIHGASPDGSRTDAADLTVDGYGAGKPTTVALAGFSADLRGAAIDHVALDAATVRNLPLADLVARGNGGNNGAGPWTGGTNAALDLGKLAVTANGKPFVTFTSFLAGADPGSADGSQSHLDVRDLVVAATPDLTPGLSQLGYDSFRGGIAMHATVDRGAGRLRMERLDIDAPAMGRLHLALGLDGVPFEALAPASGKLDVSAAIAMLRSRLQSAELTYEDHSLAGKAFATAAAGQNTTVAALKQNAVAVLNATGAQLHLGPAVLDPVAAFINDPHRLAVAVNPPQPVVLLNLPATAADPQHALGLSVTN